MGRGHFYYTTCKASLWSVSRGPSLFIRLSQASFLFARAFILKPPRLFTPQFAKKRVCFRSEWCERKAKLFGLNKVQDDAAWGFEARNTTS